MNQEPLLERLKKDLIQTSDTFIYGKTGMGKDKGIVVDSWFTGFADTKENGRIYFSIYLGETSNKNVSSTKAKENAINIINELNQNLKDIGTKNYYHIIGTDKISNLKSFF